MNFLDYASTCPVVKYPQQLYRDVLGKGYFLNPNANYAYKEKRLLSEAENRVKKAIGAKSGKVIFGGTSSQLIENLMNAISYERLGYEVVCSHYEHDSFYRYRDRDVFNLSDLKFELDTADDGIKSIVMWQAVQNLTGEIFTAKQIGELTHKYNAFYICDATALLGHVAIEPNIDDWCDFLVLDGHKIGTELGIGCCWISDRLDKWLNGFKLHGTPNLAGALAMTQAVEDACDNRSLGEKTIHYNELQDYLIGYLVGANIDFQLIPEYDEQPSGHEFTSAINAIRLSGIQAEALQQYLASKEIYIGVGHSSCSNDTRVLRAYSLSDEEAHEVIRVSFGEDNTKDDIKALIEGIKEFKEKFV